MSVSTADFWKLLSQSRLLTSQQVQQLAADYNRSANGQAEASTKSLAEWLVARNALSRYQAATVLAGRRVRSFSAITRCWIESGRDGWRGAFTRFTRRPGIRFCCDFLPARP